MKAAYDLLSSETVTEEQWGDFLATARAAPRQAGELTGLRKPKVVTRVLPLTPELVEECRALLWADSGRSETDGDDKAGRHAVAGADSPSGDGTTDHVPVAVAIHGRSLTYHIATPLVRGANRLSLPTTVLRDRTLQTPEIIAFRSATCGGGDLAAPEEVRARLFPQMRSVFFHFRAP